MEDIDCLTMYEYTLRMRSYYLTRVDKEYDMHLQAWLNHQVKTKRTKGSSKNPKQEYVYKTFHDFFNYEKRLKKVDINHKDVTTEEKKMAMVAEGVNKREEVE
ncbi:hypothetical protein [Oceanobacillus sp. 1P07AA]|uniref:hypothetical protein n=1 Tax=Oceanobacillus sp. 1P07AA TaxID=3132293 RepID=UPI0039A47196